MKIVRTLNYLVTLNGRQINLFARLNPRCDKTHDLIYDLYHTNNWGTELVKEVYVVGTTDYNTVIDYCNLSYLMEKSPGTGIDSIKTINDSVICQYTPVERVRPIIILGDKGAH